MGILHGVQNSSSLSIIHTRGPIGAYSSFPCPGTMASVAAISPRHQAEADTSNGHWHSLCVFTCVLAQITGEYPEPLHLNALELMSQNFPFPPL